MAAYVRNKLMIMSKLASLGIGHPDVVLVVTV